MKRLFGFLALSAFAAWAAPASAETIRHCALVVDGKTYIDGPCEFEPIGGGDFQIRQGKYFAYLYVGKPATGHWNGDPPGNKAHVPLGDLQRREGCWVNAQARVCAER